MHGVGNGKQLLCADIDPAAARVDLHVEVFVARGPVDAGECSVYRCAGTECGGK